MYRSEHLVVGQAENFTLHQGACWRYYSSKIISALMAPRVAIPPHLVPSGSSPVDILTRPRCVAAASAVVPTGAMGLN